MERGLGVKEGFKRLEDLGMKCGSCWYLDTGHPCRHDPTHEPHPIDGRGVS